MTSSTSTDERAPARSDLSLPPSVTAVAFWSAVLLPFCSLALLFGGLGTTLEYVGFIALVVANVLALVAGHGYGK